MQLIDGYNGGVAHISASMIRDHNLAMYGTGDCVLDVGNKFSYEVVNNNTIRINDGMAIIGGARAIVEYGQQETMVIENGVSGYMRNDLIIIEYNKDTETLKETAVLKVVKGTLGSTGVDPALVTGDIRSGATQRQMPLYRVRINGLSIEGVDKLWTGATTPISGGGTGAYTVTGAIDNLGLTGAETKKLLWENADPTSDFAAHTISLDLSSYQFVEIVSRFTTSNIGQTVDKCEVGSRVFVEKFFNATSTSAHATIMHRQIDFGSDSVIFADAKSKVTDENTSTTKNSLLIPYKIYGIKGV